jgi:N-acetylmuramoyl-L-alanine amidase
MEKRQQKSYSRWTVRAWLLLLPLYLFTSLPLQAAKTRFTLVIDAGHGGNDAGAIGRITKEKTINLNVALAFGRLVERNCPDVKVVYTRKTDVFVPLHTRADIANRNKADLFMSIHTNSLPKGRVARGMETYTLGMHRASDNLDVAMRENAVIEYEADYKQRYKGFDPKSSESYIMFEFIQDHNMAQSVELAKYVQKRTCSAAARQNKGVKQAGFLVLRETSMPSCLIELGFISTPDEEQFLHSDAGVGRLALGIYQAFLDYKQKHVPNSTPATYQPQQESQPQTQAVPQPVPQPVKPVQPVAQAPQPVAQPVAQQPVQPTAQQQVQSSSSRKRSKIAQELADAREGRGAPAKVKNTSPNADSIISAMPNGNSGPFVQLLPVVEQTPVAQSAPAAKPAPVAQPTQVVQPPAVQPAPVAQPAPAPQAASATAPVFKVQIMASGYKLKTNDPQLKGLKNVDFYQEGGMYKYTVGSSVNYIEINQLRKSIADRFPQAFVIAFKNGEKMDVQQAIQEFRRAKK